MESFLIIETQIADNVHTKAISSAEKFVWPHKYLRDSPRLIIIPQTTTFTYFFDVFLFLFLLFLKKKMSG